MKGASPEHVLIGNNGGDALRYKGQRRNQEIDNQELAVNSICGRVLYLCVWGSLQQKVDFIFARRCVERAFDEYAIVDPEEGSGLAVGVVEA